jgi:hypothetical protein
MSRMDGREFLEALIDEGPPRSRYCFALLALQNKG